MVINQTKEINIDLNFQIYLLQSKFDKLHRKEFLFFKIPFRSKRKENQDEK